MKKPFPLLIFICLCLLALPLNTFATDNTEIYITNAWARPVGDMMDMDMDDDSDMDMDDDSDMDMDDDSDIDMDDMPMGNFGVSAVYMDVENGGEHAVKLISADTQVAEFVEIHQTTVVDDVMQMRLVEDGVTIESGGVANFAPAGLHIMLINLYQPIEANSAIALNLTFAVLDDSGDVTDETFNVMIGAPALDFSPENSTDIIVVNGWVRATASSDMMDMDMGDDDDSDNMDMMIPPSAVYMTLLNRGDDDDRLINVETSASAIAEIHETNVVDNVMQMREVGGVDILAGEIATLEQGGLHIMLPELTEDLFTGEAITLTLIFDSGAELTIALPVLDGMEMMDMDE